MNEITCTSCTQPINNRMYSLSDTLEVQCESCGTMNQIDTGPYTDLALEEIRLKFAEARQPVKTTEPALQIKLLDGQFFQIAHTCKDFFLQLSTLPKATLVHVFGITPADVDEVQTAKLNLMYDIILNILYEKWEWVSSGEKVILTEKNKNEENFKICKTSKQLHQALRKNKLTFDECERLIAFFNSGKVRIIDKKRD